MTRRKTGSINPVNGRFRVRATVNGKRSILGFCATLGEAEKLRKASSLLLANEDQDALLLNTFGERWLLNRELKKLVRDPRNEWSRWKNHILPHPIAGRIIKTLERRDILSFVEYLKEKKLSRQTVLNVLNIIRGMLNEALHEGLIKVNPVASIKISRQKRTRETSTYATLKEQKRLRLAADGMIRHLIVFAYRTGLRAGELCTLRLDDVYLDGDYPHVVVRYGTVPNLSTKGGTIREVPLWGEGLDAARDWSEGLSSYAPKNPHALMFPRAGGSFRDENHVIPWKEWKTILKAVGFGRRFRFHDLRHTCGTSLLSGVWGRKWSLEEIQAFLGHSAVTTTERYARMLNEGLRSAAREAAELVPELVSQNGLSTGAALGIRTPDLRFTKSTRKLILSQGSTRKDQFGTDSVPERPFLRVTDPDAALRAAIASAVGARLYKRAALLLEALNVKETET